MDSKKIIMVNRVYYTVVAVLIIAAVMVLDFYVKGTENAAVDGFRLMFWVGVAITCVSLIRVTYVSHLLRKTKERDGLSVCCSRIFIFSFGFALCSIFFVYPVTGGINAEFLVKWTKMMSILPVAIMGYILAVMPKVDFWHSSGKCRRGSFLHSIEYLLFFTVAGKNVVVTGLAIIVSFLPVVTAYCPQFTNYCYYIGVAAATVELGLFLLFLLRLQIKFASKDLITVMLLGISEILLGIGYLTAYFLDEALMTAILFLIAVNYVMVYFLFGSGFLIEHLKHTSKKSKNNER